MAKVIIEDDCGEETIFAVDDQFATKVKACATKKVNENLGTDVSSEVKMLDNEGDEITFYLKRNTEGNIEVISYMVQNKKKVSEDKEVTFERDGNNIDINGNFFS